MALIRMTFDQLKDWQEPIYSQPLNVLREQGLVQIETTEHGLNFNYPFSIDLSKTVLTLLRLLRAKVVWGSQPQPLI